MSFVSKIKNIFYDVEEDEEEESNETKVEIPKVKEGPKISYDFAEPEPVVKSVKEEVIDSAKNDSLFNERDLFRSERTFNFTEFDDVEEVVKPTPVVEVERKVTRIERTPEVKPAPAPVIEKPKVFKPSPVISPVYGILDKDYVREDITSKKNNNIILDRDNKLKNYENVRKKAYGTKDVLEDTLINTPREILEIKEETNVSDETSKINDLVSNLDRNTTIEDVENIRKENIFEEENLEDTLEHDLFNLIDSMYDKED